MTCRLLVLTGLATVFGLASLSAAVAAPGVTAGPSAMRSGPGPRYRIVQQVPPGAMIDVQSCSPNWCRVSWRYRAGYIPTAMVEQGPGVAPPPGYYAGPPVYVELAPIIVGPGWGWGWGYRGGWGGYRGGWRR